MKVVTFKNLEEIFLVGHLVLTFSISIKTAMGLSMPYFVEQPALSNFKDPTLFSLLFLPCCSRVTIRFAKFYIIVGVVLTYR
jgi:hypothetical protein